MNEETPPPDPHPRRPTDALLESVYAELRDLAHSKMRRGLGAD